MQFWAVGSTHGTGNSLIDVTKDFVEEGIWFDGYANNGDDKWKNYLEKVEVGDVFLMKSSSTKGPKRSTAFTKLKAIGIVLDQENYYTFGIRWLNIKELPIDFDNIAYRKTIEPMRDDDMLAYVKDQLANDAALKVINLLKYKHQIILQGPPGTGKTRLAKLMAEDMIEPENKGTAEDFIDNLVKGFNTDSKEAKLAREQRQKLLSDFYKAFPKEELKDLTLDSYAIGTGDNDSFCWWIERGLQRLGYYFPGSAFSYKVYWSKSKDSYSKHGFVKDIEDNDEAIQMVADTLYKLVNDNATEQAFERFGNSFVLKVLQTYYPDVYFPINSEKGIDNALKIFNRSFKGLSLLDKNKLLTQIYLDKKQQLGSELTKHEFAKIIWDNFDLKTGKDLTQTNEVQAQGEYEIIQFHPAYTYEDFVRGIVAKTENGNISYEVENKILAEFAEKATENPNGNYVLIIDEINRANLPAVLGELIYTLEYRGDDSIKSMYEYNGDRNIKLPKNLYIIGTMNTADRSVGHIDYAIRRRFAFVDILPDVTVIPNDKAKNLFEKVARLFSDEYLSPDFHKNDVQIGHSYFIADDENELRTKWLYEIKPILNEYIKDGILIDDTQQIVDSLYE